MTPDLMDRLRAADPAAHQPDAPPDRAKLIAARRRRVSRRATGGAAATLATALAIALAPFGGGEAGPSSILASAAQAAKLPSASIIVTTSDVKVRSTGALDQRRTTWVRVSGSGKVLAVRARNVTDGRVTSDELSRGSVSGGDAVLQSRDPKTGKITTLEGTEMVPSLLLLDAQAVLRRADPADVTPATLDGRAAHRIVVTGEEDPARPGDRDELLVDAETFAPLLVRKHSEGTDVEGKPFTYDYTERVLEQQTLPDTAEHRELLKLR